MCRFICILNMCFKVFAECKNSLTNIKMLKCNMRKSVAEKILFAPRFLMSLCGLHTYLPKYIHTRPLAKTIQDLKVLFNELGILNEIIVLVTIICHERCLIFSHLNNHVLSITDIIGVAIATLTSNLKSTANCASLVAILVSMLILKL